MKKEKNIENKNKAKSIPWLEYENISIANIVKIELEKESPSVYHARKTALKNRNKFNSKRSDHSIGQQADAAFYIMRWLKYPNQYPKPSRGYSKKLHKICKKIISINSESKKFENITKEDLNQIIKIRDNETNSQFREVLTRSTPAQTKFRKNLFVNYWRCAFCDIHLPMLLDAAHIKDLEMWEKITSETYSIENGILACKNHHKLFDKKEIIIESNGKIINSSNITGLITNNQIQNEYINDLKSKKKYIQEKNK